MSKSITNILVATSESKNQMERSASLNVVLSNGLLILELLSGENKTLLSRRDTLELLNLLLENRNLR